MSWVGLFGFILFGILHTSCTWIQFPSLDLGSFNHNFFKCIFNFLFSSLSGIPIMHRLGCFILSHRSQYCFHFFSFVFLSSVLTGWFLLLCLPDHLLVLLFHLFGYSLLLDCFFTSEIASPIFNWLVIIVSSSLLHWFLFISVLFNSFSSFTNTSLNERPGRLVNSCFIICSFRWFLLVFYLRVVTLPFHVI